MAKPELENPVVAPIIQSYRELWCQHFLDLKDCHPAIRLLQVEPSLLLWRPEPSDKNHLYRETHPIWEYTSHGYTDMLVIVGYEML